uniref:Interaction protein for cytohesin exchange factors 1 n=1 Tax=Neolamprologus brichardi TaxID=32507 RepID=A0A3Q4GQ20_NEOBR
MSRRRVSVKDLGAVDCQGWLHRKKESRSFLGSRWKRYWFVLQRSSLYWYSDEMVSHSYLTVNVITASHPNVVTITIGAESYIEMNKKKKRAQSRVNTCSYTWLSCRLLLLNLTDFFLFPEKTPDEMESLYNHLKAASVNPTGQNFQRDFRASFIRRCKNEKVNEKVHLVRILKSTLKAKESELLALEKILNEPNPTALMYREWRLTNTILLQDILQHNQEAEGATSPDGIVSEILELPNTAVQ